MLSTVEETTKDVSGLHAKLDRKKEVDQHNAKAQNTFAGQMNILFSKMKDSVTENGLKQQQVLDFYVNVIGKYNISCSVIIILNHMQQKCLRFFFPKIDLV